MRRALGVQVPKAFKVIPNLHNWEEVLYLTNPEGWSPHAVYQATRLFVSNLNQRMSQRFLVLVLLPHVRADIHHNRRLHFALFQVWGSCVGGWCVGGAGWWGWERAVGGGGGIPQQCLRA